MSCCDVWSSKPEEINGKCPECGGPTVDGDAAEGCNWAPIDCETCGSRPCDQGC